MLPQPPRHTQKKHPLHDSTGQTLARHRNDTTSNSSSHALAASKRTQAVEVLGGKRLKPHQQTSRWLKPLATSLAFAFVTLSCPSVFHARTHFAEHHIRASWLLGLVESPSATQTEKLFRHRLLPGAPELECVCIGEQGRCWQFARRARRKLKPEAGLAGVAPQTPAQCRVRSSASTTGPLDGLCFALASALVVACHRPPDRTGPYRCLPS